MCFCVYIYYGHMTLLWSHDPPLGADHVTPWRQNQKRPQFGIVCRQGRGFFSPVLAGMDVDLDKVGLYHCKRCSKCGFVHAPPFKSRCRYLLGIELPEGILPADTVATVATDATGAMACLGGSGFTDPEDPEYHAWCEAQARERAYDKDINSRVLQQIMNRLGRLELQPKAIPPWKKSNFDIREYPLNS